MNRFLRGAALSGVAALLVAAVVGLSGRDRIRRR